MNTKLIHMPFLSVLLALTACTDGHDSLPPVNTGGDILRISSVTMEGAAGAASRGIITEVGTGADQLSSIGVYTVGVNGTSETEYKPAHGKNTGIYKYSGSTWTSTATQPADALRLPTDLFFFLYYLYCLSIFQRTCCFRFKSGCKGKRFYFNHQMFSEVFFAFLFLSFLRLS